MWLIGTNLTWANRWKGFHIRVALCGACASLSRADLLGVRLRFDQVVVASVNPLDAASPDRRPDPSAPRSVSCRSTFPRRRPTEPLSAAVHPVAAPSYQFVTVTYWSVARVFIPPGSCWPKPRRTAPPGCTRRPPVAVAPASHAVPRTPRSAIGWRPSSRWPTGPESFRFAGC